ncbi:hypothetical protein ACI0FN_00561 [Alcaligenes nematophilus]
MLLRVKRITPNLLKTFGLLGLLTWGIGAHAASFDYSKAQGLSRTETYCIDQQGPPGTLTKCILEQTQAEESISNYLKTGSEEKYINCISYSTGFRDLGSSENIDQTHVAKCLHTSNPEQKFRSCVIRYTGQPQKGGIIHWRRAEANKIADCFNG